MSQTRPARPVVFVPDDLRIDVTNLEASVNNAVRFVRGQALFEHALNGSVNGFQSERGRPVLRVRYTYCVPDDPCYFATEVIGIPFTTVASIAQYQQALGLLQGALSELAGPVTAERGDPPVQNPVESADSRGVTAGDASCYRWSVRSGEGV